MNDNIQPSSEHHAICLETLRNVHSALDAAVKLGIVPSDPDASEWLDFKFWRDGIANVLNTPFAHSFPQGQTPSPSLIPSGVNHSFPQG